MSAPNVTCFHCGKAYYTPPSRIASNATGRFFCRMECLRAWQATTKIVTTCADCGKEIERYKHYADLCEIMFCNQKCRANWMSKQTGEKHPRYIPPVVKPCDTCGKTIERKSYRVGETERAHHFCSKECRTQWLGKNRTENFSGPNSPFWKGGTIKYYGPNWNRQARAARKRDKHKCQHCGVAEAKLNKKLDVHHIVPFRTFGYIPDKNENYRDANRLSNLISLCPSCHRNIESGKIGLQIPLLDSE